MKGWWEDLPASAEADIERVRRMVRSAFPVGPPPHRERITAHSCDECDAVERALAGHAWTDLPRATIDAQHANLPLLSHEARRYFFPAFLLRALDAFDPGSECVSSIMFTLSPTKTPADDPRYLALVGLFSEAERVAIVAFLGLVLADERFFMEHKAAERALRKHWKVPDTPGAETG